MAKNRDKVSIIAALLQATNSGANKTDIMLKANLSYQLLEKYLGTAIRLCFIQPNNKIYVLTERGREFLNRYKRYQNEFAGVEKTLKKLTEERELLRFLCQEKAATKTVPINSSTENKKLNFSLSTNLSSSFLFKTLKRTRLKKALATPCPVIIYQKR